MNFDDFVGLPWVDQGRGPDAFDCWGLVRAAFAAGTGIELPSHAGAYDLSDAEEIASLVAGEASRWSPVAAGREVAFDVAVMRLAGTLHVGIVVGRGQMLHVRRGRLSAIEPLARFRNLDLYRFAFSAP
jgi:cell wall-associated NlpC family hydrolase